MGTIYKVAVCDACLDSLAHDMPKTGISVYTMFGDRWHNFSSSDKRKILKLVGLRPRSDLCVSWNGRWLCQKHVQKILDGFDLYFSCAEIVEKTREE